MEKLNKKIIELVNHVKEISTSNCVSFSLFLNAHGYEVQFQEKDSETLKKEDLSMRNLKGEYIE